MSKRLSSSGDHSQNPTSADLQLAGQIHPAKTETLGKLRTPRPIVSKDTNDALFRVELALSRLENGDYGYCACCGSPIAIETLEEDPTAVICHRCKAT